MSPARRPHPYDPECPHCRPVIVDTRTGLVLPPTDPIMKAVDAIWQTLAIETKEAFIRVTVDNGRDENDLRLVSGFLEQIKQEVKP